MRCEPLEVNTIEAGQLVTVLARSDGDRSYVGEAFEVLHVALPFLAVKLLASRYGLAGHRTSFDTRKMTLSAIEAEYADALNGVD